jgi:hypothetical protein
VTWFGVFLIVYWALNLVFLFGIVGRSVYYSAPVATFMAMVYLLLIWGVVGVGTNP